MGVGDAARPVARTRTARHRSLAAGFGLPQALAQEVEQYWNTLRSDKVQLAGRGVNPAVFAFASGILARTDEIAEQRAREGLELFGFGLTGGAVFGVSDPDHHLYDAFLDFKAGRRDIREDAPLPPPVRQLMLDMGRHYAQLPTTLMGGPQKGIEYGRMLQAAHVDGMMLRYDFGVPHEYAMESLEIFAKEVIPELRATEEEQRAWRKEQLAGIPYPIVSSV